MQTSEAHIRATKRQKQSANANASTVVSSHVIDLSEDDDVNHLPAVSMGAPAAIDLRGSNPTGAAFHRHRDQPCHVHTSAATGTIGSQAPPQLQQLLPPQRPRQAAPKAAASKAQEAGYIDLLGVTDAFEGALQAASHRVDDASDGSALAKALAEKADLERQLQEALANKQASHPDQPLRAPMPSHWVPMPQGAQVLYVELPLPPGCSPATSGQTRLPGPPPLDQATVKAMVYQGLTQEDAEAALRHCEGDGDAAMLYAVECMGSGGPAACAQRRVALTSDSAESAQALAEAAAHQARQEADLQEAQQVLARFTGNNSSAKLAHVVRIERVQNPHLWTKYCLRRHEVELAAGAARVNEQLLFHGCHKDVVSVIGTEGFDIRVAGMAGSLGAGTYFAGNSNYSMGYVDKAVAPTMNMSWAAAQYGAYATGVFNQSAMPVFPSNTLLGAAAAPGRASAASILPHPSRRGVGKSGSPKQAKGGKSRSQAQEKAIEGGGSEPGFLPEAKALLVCRVALGRLHTGQPGLRLPPKGYDAVTCEGGIGFPKALAAAIFAVFDNSQAYPEYVVHYKTH